MTQTHETEMMLHGEEDANLAPPPDDKNPALIDLEHSFVVLLIGAALFIGAVFVFIL